MNFIISVAFGFLCGSIPFGYIIARMRGIEDIRKVGSGNIGATNVGRVCGKKYGFIVSILDILKGFLPTFIIMHSQKFGVNLAIICGFASILGHVFSPWLKGRGGKGAATGLGVFLGLVTVQAIIAFGVWGLLVLAFGWVSLASMSAALVLVILVFLKNGLGALFFMVLLGFLLIVFSHRKNIRRLINHQEPKIR
ncbi:MAG: glycerol-3-phosphate 1-O-acyltransferase PlsY [bacterium]|nr:glycerol-3-phosphate 1-O-acyltransferase PlsY [bacterium]